MVHPFYCGQSNIRFIPSQSMMKKQTSTMIWGVMMALLSPFLFLSCVDDEKFTTSSGAVLQLELDTLRFDTIFTGLTSTTERFIVHNRNDKALRIADVSLKSSGRSGFMINVDGQSGTSVSNVEVLKKDSVFVFVKVNLPRSSSMKPTFVRDTIIFTLESGMRQQVVLEASGQNFRELRAEVLKSDRIIKADELPYVIYDSLVVGKGVTLEIEAGTTLYFHNGANLIVHGELKAEGTREKHIVFRGDRLDKMFDYLPYDRLENQWGSIYLSKDCTGCTLDYADIHSGNNGISCDGIGGNLKITNSVIHNVAGHGLYLKDTKATVANTQISNAKYNCVSIYGGTSDFYHCTLAQFYPWNADRGHALLVSNYLDEEEHLIESAHFYNCFVTGYANDEVFGEPGDKTLNLHFNNCVLLTDVADNTYFHDCIGESKDSVTYQSTNFKTFDTHAYIYDFRLDTFSVARGKGSSTYAELYPADMDGILRGKKPDAGCFQFVEKKKE